MDRNREERHRGKRHIGIMGGTFDPIHNAHLALARQAYRQFSLNEVWLLPNGNPPHKRGSRQADVSHRLEMARLAAAESAGREGEPFLKLCRMEQSKRGYHYTYETLRQLNTDYPDTQFYFIMGADSLFDFEKWREPGIISRECILLAAARDCDKGRLRARISELEEKFGADVRILDTPDMDTASEDIRRKIAAGEDISCMVPASVEAYIRRTGLYRDGSGAKPEP